MHCHSGDIIAQTLISRDSMYYVVSCHIIIVGKTPIDFDHIAHTYRVLRGRVILVTSRPVTLQQRLEALDVLNRVPQYLHFR